ncbi:MAG: hypothetical protein PVH29_11935 [Candidatus Zixiibacteriota bacterium]|jgi:hypothetical protein
MVFVARHFKKAFRSPGLGGPALARHDGRLFLAWIAYDGTGKVRFVSSRDGIYFEPAFTAPWKSGPGIALASCYGRLYFAWTAPGPGGNFYVGWCDECDGRPAGWARLPFQSKTGPALAAFNGNLYAAWAGYENRITVARLHEDGDVDHRSVVTLNGASIDGPALAAHEGRLYVAWAGFYLHRGLFLACSEDGERFDVPAAPRADEVGIRGPALASSPEGLTLVWVGRAPERQILLLDDAVDAACEARPIPASGVRARPGAAFFEGLKIAWTSAEDLCVNLAFETAPPGTDLPPYCPPLKSPAGGAGGGRG